VNIQDYISSGIIESYVLGLADPEERREFEHLAQEYPELHEAREAFELSLETNMQFANLTPPAQIKSKIFSEIEMESHQTATSFSGGGRTVPPVIAGADEKSYGGGSRSSALVIRKDFSRFLAAAAVVLLLMSTALNFYFFYRYKQYNDKYQALIASQTDLASYNQILQMRLLEAEKTIDMMKDPAMYIVKMPAVANSPDPKSATTVYWDTRTKDVYLAINSLPKPQENQQYQLWAMVDGKPVDAGVIEMKGGSGMTRMKNIPRAEAFAITLEKKGGSSTPSLDKLYVMGRV
jgi:anti-sigma-K factor RskA